MKYITENGLINSHQRIAEGVGGEYGPSHDWTRFGLALTVFPDLDNNGMSDLVVSTPGATGSRGSVLLLYLDPAGTCLSFSKIARDVGGFTAELVSSNYFGCQVSRSHPTKYWPYLPPVMIQNRRELSFCYFSTKQSHSGTRQS